LCEAEPLGHRANGLSGVHARERLLEVVQMLRSTKRSTPALARAFKCCAEAFMRMNAR
jgi:hypothetical protein